MSSSSEDEASASSAWTTSMRCGPIAATSKLSNCDVAVGPSRLSLLGGALLASRSSCDEPTALLIMSLRSDPPASASLSGDPTAAASRRNLFRAWRSANCSSASASMLTHTSRLTERIACTFSFSLELYPTFRLRLDNTAARERSPGCWRVALDYSVLQHPSISSQVKSRDQLSSPQRQLREWRVPLESPGDVGENALT